MLVYSQSQSQLSTLNSLLSLSAKYRPDGMYGVQIIIDNVNTGYAESVIYLGSGQEAEFVTKFLHILFQTFTHLLFLCKSYESCLIFYFPLNVIKII